MTVAALLAAYRSGALDPREVVGRARARAAAAGAPAWISVVAEEDLARRLAALPPPEAPLYGIPFAVKVNVDAAGLPTTAGCPAFAFEPPQSAEAVARLEAAGAVVVGKTALDQFATGLTGARSPHGPCASVIAPHRVSGGSSSGSAVAVADGTVPFALGTDTAGSGRVPAAFNGLVGLKPTRGLVSTRGVVPACRSLDCVSVFTRTAADAAAVLDVLAGPDPGDPWSRAVRPLPAAGAAVVVGVPASAAFLDAASEAAWASTLEHAEALGWVVVPVDPAPFHEAGALLYEGPWVAERFAAVGAFIAAHPEAVDPAVAAIVSAGDRPSAAELFAARHRHAELRSAVAPVLAGADALLWPTAPGHPTLAEVAADPVGPNAALGAFTNFVNLLDLAAVAVPAAPRADGTPFGVTLMAPAGGDARLLDLAARWAGEPQVLAADAAGARTALAVVGAHLSGQPLNGQLTGLGGRLLETARTAPTYRLYALPPGNGGPARPGLVGGADGDGDGVEVELWSLDPEGLGRLLALIPPPLGLGTVALADGRSVLGFLCEAWAADGAPDITAFGGWRAFLAAQAVPA